MSLRLRLNPSPAAPGLVVLPEAGFRRAQREIAFWRGHDPAPLEDDPDLAQHARLSLVRIARTTDRVAAAYAALHLLRAHLARAGIDATAAELLERRHDLAAVTLASADGQPPGPAVAWAAARYGAGHRRLTQEAAASPDTAGCLLISDVARPGFTEVPRLIMQAYRVMAADALAQWQGPPPTHVVAPGAGGSLAAAISAQLRAALSPAPALIVVEPASDCPLFAGASANLLAWQELERAASGFIAIEHETGAAAGLVAAAQEAAARAALRLDADSRALVFAADPDRAA